MTIRCDDDDVNDGSWYKCPYIAGDLGLDREGDSGVVVQRLETPIGRPCRQFSG